MGGRSPLSAGQPRVLGRHDGWQGAIFRRAWRALVAEFGLPPSGSLLHLEMGRVAGLYVTQEAATRRLADARRARATGRGRRPSESEILRLETRVGLTDVSFVAGLDRLRELGEKRNRHLVPTPAELLAAARRASGA